MPKSLIEHLASGMSLDELEKIAKKEKTKLSFFDKVSNKKISLVEYLIKYQKYKRYTFEDFLMSECTDINERNEEGERLITYLARIGDLKYFKCVLCLGATFKSHDYDDATVGIKRFLDYRPGASEDSIRDYCLKSNSNIKRIIALTHDQEDTTSAESSTSESEDENLKLSKAEQRIKKSA